MKNSVSVTLYAPYEDFEFDGLKKALDFAISSGREADVLYNGELVWQSYDGSKDLETAMADCINILHPETETEEAYCIASNVVYIQGMWAIKTDRVFVYEDENENYLYSDEIIDVRTGEHYGFNGIIHLIGNPIDVFYEKKRVKRGHHSNSSNKQRARARKPFDDLPF